LFEKRGLLCSFWEGKESTQDPFSLYREQVAIKTRGKRPTRKTMVSLGEKGGTAQRIIRPEHKISVVRRADPLAVQP